MKIFLMTLLVSGLMAFNAIGENGSNSNSRGEDVLAALFYKPAADETYGNGWGGEYQTRAWLNENFGAALSISLASWKVDGQSSEIGPDGVTLATKIDGDVTMIPVGGSLLLRAAPAEKLALTLEGGIRYVQVNADADYNASILSGSDVVLSDQGGVHIENGVVGIVGATIENTIDHGPAILFGIGYQFDLAKGFAKAGDSYLGRSELGSLVVRVGISF